MTKKFARGLPNTEGFLSGWLYSLEDMVQVARDLRWRGGQTTDQDRKRAWAFHEVASDTLRGTNDESRLVAFGPHADRSQRAYDDSPFSGIWAAQMRGG